MSEWRGHLKSCPSLLRGTAKNIGQATKEYKGSLIQGWYLIQLHFSNWMRLICNNDQSVAWHLWHCRFCTILPSRANFHLLSTPNSIVTTGFNCQRRIRLQSSEYCNNWRLLPIAAFSQYTMHFTTSPISVSFNVRNRNKVSLQYWTNDTWGRGLHNELAQKKSNNPIQELWRSWVPLIKWWQYRIE